MINQSIVLMEATITLQELVNEYINEFGLGPRPRMVGVPPSNAEKQGDILMSVSIVDDMDRDSVVRACIKTVSAMNDFENEFVISDLSSRRDRRRKIEQIKSILHISRTYPENAIKRLKGLRPKYEKEKK